MGKAERIRSQTARQRIAAQQAAARKAEQRRRALIAGAAGKIPFIDVGGADVDSGAQYPPSVLGSLPTTDPSHFSLTWAQIASDIRNASSPAAESVLGAANRITAAICKLTHGQPGSVCQSTAVTSVSGSI
jgi:hypothetical protein